MPTNKKSGPPRWRALGSALGLAIVLSGCEPQGPKALLEGERLLDQGRPDDALRMLELAADKMPREARAWNLLALAHHRRGELPEAALAYNKALVLDHRLSSARFNLGCLYLEQGQTALALNELTAYTMVQRRDLNGWLKLALAHSRLNHVEAAETSFRNALSVSPRDPEALNGLGVIQAGRKKYVESVQYFQAALAENPGYAPALLNQATVTHRHLNQKSTALQKYRQYLALQPPPENAEAVRQIAQALADDLSGATRARLALAATNAPWGGAHSNMISTANVITRTNPISKPSSPVVAIATETKLPPPAPAAPTTNRPALGSAEAVSDRIAKPANPPAPAPVLEPPPPPLVISEVPRDVTVLTPQAIVPPNPAPSPPPVALANPPPSAAPRAPIEATPAPEARRGFLSRLNPFRRGSAPEPPSRPPATTVYANPSPVPASPPPVESPIPSGSYKRYAYRSLPRPQSGDRIKAVELVNKGVIAHQDRRSEEEEEGMYRSALLSDPSSYDALFNLGSLASERGAWTTALDYYERALTIDPESISARYQFAMALRQSEYPVDAARELERILQGHANDPKALLGLGNLHAQRFKQPSIARHYYLRFLEAAPDHPKAPEVRFWLSANP
ncbi:MAG: tetratricopeptide repeat protein [Verrucomicrobia bacterium]|nr:tetratricopeptide repeat protein [Verrucomicrobiota bacterium]MBI3867950.1 tetratricopeptide repeat protein [Verrucomicrobiota bacterium]